MARTGCDGRRPTMRNPRAAPVRAGRRRGDHARRHSHRARARRRGIPCNQTRPSLRRLGTEPGTDAMTTMLGTFVLRFDLRAPAVGAPIADLYATALDMAGWSEQHGFTAVVVSEHHAADDGYLPSPLIVAAAIAARTKEIAISVAALLVPLYDPVKLAEDIAVLDHVSRGRVSYVAGIGYRPAEYASLGKRFATRGADIEAAITLMRRAWTGEAFEHDGRIVQ